MHIAFDTRERRRQTNYFRAQFPEKTGYKGVEYRLLLAHTPFNLAPSIREMAIAYFDLHRVAWHSHANHGLSSQVCCLNFLMPLAERPAALARLVSRALAISEPEMLAVESGPGGRPWFVGFEWIGGDYLNEAGSASSRTRGSNCTSADAVVRFRQGADIVTLLIEWKYTEKYGQPISLAGNETRTRRYEALVFDPGGPLRSDLGLKLEDFFWEPLYQLLRQQMLAFQIQKAQESDHVRVLHIAPAENVALKRVTSPVLRRFGSNVTDVFRSLLVRPEDFISITTEDLFGPLLTELRQSDSWSAYLARRYAFACGPVSMKNGQG